MVTILNSIDSKKKLNLKTQMKYIIWVIIICVISTGLSVLLGETGMGKQNSLMIFLIGVLVITVLTKGYQYGFIASILNLFMFNYFFAEPLHSFAVSDLQDYVLIAFFLLASLICGTLSSKFQYQVKIANQNAHTAQLLYNISESFLKLSGVPSIIENGMNYIHDYTGYPCSVTLDRNKFDSKELNYTTSDFDIIEYNKNRKYTLPIKASVNEIGTITFANVELPLHSEVDMFIKTVLYQMALILDREFIYNERERIKVAMEGEHLKSTLLRSISHDIRTPLTGIMGASSMILDSYESLDENSIKKLVSDINEESAWLFNSVQNILDMTRISEGKLTLKKEYEAVDDLINQAVMHVPRLTSANRLHVTIPEDILLIEVDGRLIVQVLVNLLDNAYKHSGKTSMVELIAFREKADVVFEVSDNGFGIDEAIKDTLFEGFITLPRNSADSSRGVGLGLSICKAIVYAHDGKITAYNKPEGGSVFHVELPYEPEQ